MNYIFGPVPSRRLGYSLGVDILPYKTCTLDCIYCQLGRTTCKTLERKSWISPAPVMKELEKILSEKCQIDHITFSGSGEPTLNSSLGEIIKNIKTICSIPVAVLTNGTLLHLPEVRLDLHEADLVVPSFDAATDDTFRLINRPCHGLDLQNMLEGLRAFCREFAGTIWLEVMIVKGVNDKRQELEYIAEALADCNADSIHINSVSRPPADAGIEPADRDVLETAKSLFGEKSEIIGEFTKEKLVAEQADIREKIFMLVSRHPCSLKHISLSLGIPEGIIETHLRDMLGAQRISVVIHGHDTFYKL